MPQDNVIPCSFCQGTGEQRLPPGDDSIQDQVKELRSLLFKLDEYRLEQRKMLNIGIYELQKKCKHPPGAVTYSHDPSGGRDSTYRCDHCWKEW